MEEIKEEVRVTQGMLQAILGGQGGNVTDLGDDVLPDAIRLPFETLPEIETAEDIIERDTSVRRTMVSETRCVL